jgi:peptidoglycan/xylan/chitin deacetylase (PgdA/CDA1 family)
VRTVSLLFHDVFVREPGESGFRSQAATRYKLSLAAFEAQLAGIASVRADAPIHPFLITFDDGGLSYHTVVADRLEARGWRGHCFVSTDLIGRPGFLDARQIRDLDARGHVIGSHSASHPARFSACSVDQMRREWSYSRRVLEDLLGHPVTTASVPGGAFSRTVAAAAHDAGLRLLFTSEPSTSLGSNRECAVLGRFTIRRGDGIDLARRLVLPSPWARLGAWARWNAKGVIKPVLGSQYARLADRFLADGAVGRSSKIP